MTQALKINYITRRPEGFGGNRRVAGSRVSYMETIRIYLINQFSMFKIFPTNNSHGCLPNTPLIDHIHFKKSSVFLFSSFPCQYPQLCPCFSSHFILTRYYFTRWSRIVLQQRRSVLQTQFQSRGTTGQCQRQLKERKKEKGKSQAVS